MRSISVRMHVCLLLAACGSADPAPRTSERAVPVVASGRARMSEPITGSHGGNIQRIAVTDDGGAAVSADATGLRLWPALDGSREPVVVHGALPQALAIARADDGFVIADLDSARGVELIRFTAAGIERGRVSVPGLAIVQVELTARGAIVVREDQAVELVDWRGETRARLTAEPGERVAELLHRTGGVLALVQRGSQLRGRWLEVADEGLAWGATTPVLPLDPRHAISLSPDHLRVAGARSELLDPVTIELATGKPGAAVCFRAMASPGSEVLTAEEQRPQILGFVDAATVACSDSAQLVWWSVGSEEVGARRGEPVTMTGVDAAFAGGRAIAGLGHQLALYAPGGAHYLGYALRDLGAVRITEAGVLIGKGDQQPMLLDARFRVRARYALPRPEESWRDLFPLDARYLLTSQVRTMQQDAWANAYELAIYDTQTKAVHQVLDARAGAPDLAYDAATQLLVTSDAAKPVLLRFEPLTRTFGRRIVIAARGPVSRVYLTDPALASGVVALAVRADDNGAVIDELYADDINGDELAPRSSYRVPDQPMTIDRAGHAYVHHPAYGDLVSVYNHGVMQANVPGIANATLYPSPDGAFVAALAAPRITLATPVGGVLWRSVAWETSELGWAAGNTLVARFPTGLAQLDGMTGAIADRQCGWAFGLSETPFETSGSAANVCDVAP